MSESRPPFPPFALLVALRKVQAAEVAWNTYAPEDAAFVYVPDSVWPNRDESLAGGHQIIEFLSRKRERELYYALRKGPWGFRVNRIAVCFQYELHDDQVQWWRSYGNRAVGVRAERLMSRREASTVAAWQDPRLTARLHVDLLRVTGASC